MSREIKVGMLVLVALVVVAIATFAIGDRSNLFALKNQYSVRLETVSGLDAGNPVQLNGVVVGRVEKIVLPEEIDESLLTIWLTIERRFGNRVRSDSEARIKTLGLLGDKYIEVTSGSVGAELIPSGGEIPAAPATDVEKLIASGEDVVDNVVAISVSLRNILAGMEAGEGILGELTTDSEAGRRAKVALIETLEAVRRISDKIESGEGTLAELINEDGVVVRLNGALDRFEGVLATVESGDGALPALLNDPETRRRVETTIDRLGEAAEGIAETADELRAGDGLLVKLLSDEEYATEVSDDLKQLIHNLNKLSKRIESGEGTLGQIINDPQVYQAVDDILVGIDESRLLRWLIRNRQKKGIEVRYEEQSGPAKPEAVENPDR